ncbi:hypothetical protein ABW20_dc0107060 [Dactylellina cionopaga]|nr:hypothetical protein ABW20_dc0107060 [Dactylellina cionopaga]
MTASGLSTLPTELHTQILEYITEIDDQASTSQTCRLWQQIVGQSKSLKAARYNLGGGAYIPPSHQILDFYLDHLRCRVQDGAITAFFLNTIKHGFIEAAFANTDPLFNPSANGFCALAWNINEPRWGRIRSRINRQWNLEHERSYMEEAILQSTRFQNRQYLEQKDVYDSVVFKFRIDRARYRTVCKWWDILVLKRGSTVREWLELALKKLKTRLIQEDMEIDGLFEMNIRDGYLNSPKEWSIEVLLITHQGEDRRHDKTTTQLISFSTE